MIVYSYYIPPSSPPKNCNIGNCKVLERLLYERVYLLKKKEIDAKPEKKKKRIPEIQENTTEIQKIEEKNRITLLVH